MFIYFKAVRLLNFMSDRLTIWPEGWMTTKMVMAANTRGKTALGYYFIANRIQPALWRWSERDILKAVAELMKKGN